MKEKLSAIILFLIFTFNVPLLSRDIDLDAIYLEKNSNLYSRITSAKEKIYETISSLFVDSNVIYSGWAGGDDIVYIKEYSGINIIYKYTKGNRAKEEIARFDGTMTAALLSRSGSFLYIKNLYYNDDAAAVSELITVDINSKDLRKKKASYLFLDFTLSPTGEGIVYQTERGIVKTDPAGKEGKVVIPRDVYSNLSAGGDPVLAYISPDEKKSVLISGNGGSYRTRIVTPAGQKELSGVTSGTDLKWIDNSRFIYRSGGGGDYSVKVYDTASGRSKDILSGTLNPDINFSEIPGIITCLDNQAITVVYRDLKRRIDTGIEGEESYFSPDGRKFTSIYLGKLYVNSLNMVEKYRIEIRRNAKELIALYRKAEETKTEWQSDYTPEYLNKKIRQYDRLLKMKEKN